jgi:AcrR family transcriptional regulator
MDLGERVVRRRRGAALEEALLEATWQELFDTGYAALTIDGVAHRARTSRPVIYRRWASKQELVRAAVTWRFRRDNMTTPDTGSVRGDLLALMRYANARRAPLSAMLFYYLGPYFQETGTSPGEFRRDMIGDRVTAIDTVLDRAVGRGEIDPDRLTPRLRTLAFDLYRHEILMTLQPVPEPVIEEILDEVFLPLVRAEP